MDEFPGSTSSTLISVCHIPVTLSIHDMARFCRQKVDTWPISASIEATSGTVGFTYPPRRIVMEAVHTRPDRMVLNPFPPQVKNRTWQFLLFTRCSAMGLLQSSSIYLVGHCLWLEMAMAPTMRSYGQLTRSEIMFSGAVLAPHLLHLRGTEQLGGKENKICVDFTKYKGRAIRLNLTTYLTRGSAVLTCGSDQASSRSGLSSRSIITFNLVSTSR